jgi:hypothetical protein
MHFFTVELSVLARPTKSYLIFRRIVAVLDLLRRRASCWAEMVCTAANDLPLTGRARRAIPSFFTQSRTLIGCKCYFITIVSFRTFEQYTTLCIMTKWCKRLIVSRDIGTSK